MTSRSTRRITASLVSSLAIAGALAGTAGAWIPSVEADEPLSASRSIVVVPDAFERAAKRKATKLQKTVAVAPDAFERAVGAGPRRKRGGVRDADSTADLSTQASELGRDGVTTLVVNHHKRCHARDEDL